MATTTPIQNLPVPEDADDPNIPGDITALANAIERRLAAVYSSAADRDARPSPQEGQVAILTDVNKIYCYLDSVWVQIHPSVPREVFVETVAPSNSTGVNGDLYFQV